MKRKNTAQSPRTNSSFVSNISFDRSFKDMSLDWDSEMSSVLESFQLFRNMRQELRDEIDQVNAQGSSVQARLQEEIDTMVAQRQEESNEIHSLQIELNQLQASRDALLADIEEADEQIRNLYDELNRYQALLHENSQEYSNYEMIQKLKVPRLRNQITLYATISGIKWDYENEKMLQGTVVSKFRVSTRLLGNVCIISHRPLFFSRFLPRKLSNLFRLTRQRDLDSKLPTSFGV